MHRKIVEWLQSPSDQKPDKKNIQRLTELIAINYGQVDISRIGPTPNNSVWGREGLTPNEALELTSLIQFFFGCVHVTGEGEAVVELHEVVQREIQRLESGSKLLLPTNTETQVFTNEAARRTLWKPNRRR